jgi:hypothetical protein
MSENEWVTSDRLRVPATSTDPGDPAEVFDASRWSTHPSKPAPVDAEF